jgi:hypothetical protein
MGRDFKIIEETEDYLINFDEGLYTHVPKKYTPYQYKTAKTLKSLRNKLKKVESKVI